MTDQDVELDVNEADTAKSGEIGPTHSIAVVDRVEVYWSGGDEYYPRTIDSYDPDSGRHAF